MKPEPTVLLCGTSLIYSKQKAYLNVRSILLDKIRFLINRTKVGAFCISETRLNFSITDSVIGIGTIAWSEKTAIGIGGGVCVFIRSDLNRF